MVGRAWKSGSLVAVFSHIECDSTTKLGTCPCRYISWEERVLIEQENKNVK